MTQDHISRLIISDKVLATSQIKNGGTNRGEGGKGNVEINQEADQEIFYYLSKLRRKFVELFQKFSFDVYDSKFSFFFFYFRDERLEKGMISFSILFLSPMNSSLTFRILSSNAKWIKYLSYRPRVTQDED